MGESKYDDFRDLEVCRECPKHNYVKWIILIVT